MILSGLNSGKTGNSGKSFFFFFRLIKNHFIENLVFKVATKVSKKSVNCHSDWNILSFFSMCLRIAARNPKYCRDVSGLPRIIASCTEFKFTKLMVCSFQTCLDQNRKTAYNLIASHGDVENLIFFAMLMQGL